MKTAKRKANEPSRYLLALLMWFIVWTLTQGFFINTDWLDLFANDSTTAVIRATIYFIVVMVTLGVVFRKQLPAIFPKQKYLWLYALVVLTIIYMLATHHTIGILPTPTYLFMIVVTVSWQDILTFGALQTKLEHLSARYGWLIVAAVFWYGHVVFDLSSTFADPFGALLLLVAAFGFAWLRKITGSFYVPNVLHLLFYMVLLP